MPEMRHSVQLYFNPRFREGSDHFQSCHPRQPVYFNPRSREGSDSQERSASYEKGISIHAAAKEATIIDPFSYKLRSISIHAAAKEATIDDFSDRRLKQFQSTQPRRKRRAMRQPKEIPYFISIHAAAKEATADMYNFLVYICKNHSTTYKLIIVLLFHTVKQIKYSYWKKCESICIFMYTCDSHLTLSGLICIHPFHHWLRFDGENLVYYEAIINQYSTPKS